jgi:hypothetical protein
LNDPANSAVNFTNLYFFDLTAGQDVDDNPAELTITNCQTTLPTGGVLTDFFTKGTDANVTSVTTPTVGATKSAFTGWTLADAIGELADF